MSEQGEANNILARMQRYSVASGEAGVDALVGGDSNDRLYGGAGSDLIRMERQHT